MSNVVFPQFLSSLVLATDRSPLPQRDKGPDGAQTSLADSRVMQTTQKDSEQAADGKEGRDRAAACKEAGSSGT